LLTVRLTPIWQLAILPADPVYCRLTPTECLPCFKKPVSSLIQVVIGARVLIASIAYRPAKRRTVASSQSDFETKCNRLWCAASTRSGSGQVSAAIGSTLLRSRSLNSPRV